MMEKKKTIFKTGISECYWCGIDETKRDFEPARIKFGNESPAHTSWLDELLKGGLRLQEGKALTLLLTGPPGSGKTTLALELCYRLSIINKLFSLFISTEAHTNQIIENAKSFGWKEATDRIIAFESRKPDMSAVAVWGADEIKTWETLEQLIDLAISALKVWFNQINPGALQEMARIIIRNQKSKKIENVRPDIVVIDSLNILKFQEQGEAFQKLLSINSHVDNPAKLVIFVLDSETNSKEHKFWEYVSDIVIRLDHLYHNDYYARKIEIMKARFQEHVWGQHQLKIYPRFEVSTKDDLDDARTLQRAHPYRREGGIFIYPSIHYYLSECKRKAPTQAPRQAETIPFRLNDILRHPKDSDSIKNRGFPEGRCTAFIGNRGGHKSHLGYLHLLNRILKHGEKALIITLRDDEEMTKQTLDGVIKQQFRDNSIEVSELEDSNRLEILYYPPGYITPEEFIHRALMSISRLKKNTDKLTVLFNSLDQLGARFPLCAKQEIFVPGLIEILSAEQITSIFIAVTEPGQPEEQYGLLSMADLIMSFDMQHFKFQEYFEHLNEVWQYEKRENEIKERVKKVKEKFGKTIRYEIVLQIIRFAGGQRAGAKGILELVDEHQLDDSLYVKPGLHFTPLSQKESG